MLLGFVFVVLNNVASVMIPPYVRQATDAIISAQSQNQSQLMDALQTFMLWIIGFALLKGIFMFLMRQTLVVMSRWVERDLRSDMMHMALQQDQSFYTKFSVGDMMNRMMEDIAQVRMFCGPVIMYLINTFSMVIMVVAMMLAVSQTLTLWVLFPLPILAFLIFRINSSIYQKSIKVQEALSDMTALNQESFTNAKMIKALNAESWTIGLFNNISLESKKRNISLAKLRAWFFPLVQLFVTFSILVAVYIGANQVIDGTLSYGNIVEFVLYINMIMFPIGSLGWVFAEMEKAFSSMDRISDVMTVAKPEEYLPEVDFKSEIAAKSLSYSFDEADREALYDIDLGIKKGSKNLLIGKIGSGKSTLISLLLGMRTPTSGKVLIDAHDLEGIDKEHYRSKIALVSQEAILFSDTIENNIKFYDQNISEERYHQVLQDCQLQEEVSKFSLQDQTMIGEKGVLLSGGQKQRIALARALINPDVEFFILDDPFAAVDVENEMKIWKNLDDYFKNKTVIFVANRVNKALEFDQVILLEDGKLVGKGTPQAMSDQHEFYTNMLIG